MKNAITVQEIRKRMIRLQTKVTDHQLDVFIVSQKESIYYLAGVSYQPLERPFFILVWPDLPAELLVPALEESILMLRRMSKAFPPIGSIHRLLEKGMPKSWRPS